MEQQVLVFGEPVVQLPKDLFIPPDALRVLLETFSGPLDVLVYLIRKQNFDVLDIPVALITEQYLAYLEVMEQLDMALAAEYLLMAATLAEIKARMLLPRPPLPEDAEEAPDPRAALAEQLLLYVQTGQAAEALAALPRVGAGTALSAHAGKLAEMLRRLWLRHDLRRAHEVESEEFSLTERMDAMQARLRHHDGWQSLSSFCQAGEGRGGLVISRMAMLELDRSQLLEWQQKALFAPVDVRLRGGRC